ncbi:hypothetical protein EVAR_59088_1 [Eumeta japonica]|uniref:Uncharacterized protein n=1 Tax=Eumeta variegata TaxID=151549 RepID=A0A4C1YZP6_EUMVA|nr:hypothetical protein EVAR_59088_1 [Eumeta japonica]
MNELLLYLLTNKRLDELYKKDKKIYSVPEGCLGQGKRQLICKSGVQVLDESALKNTDLTVSSGLAFDSDLPTAPHSDPGHPLDSDPRPELAFDYSTVSFSVLISLWIMHAVLLFILIPLSVTVPIWTNLGNEIKKLSKIEYGTEPKSSVKPVLEPGTGLGQNQEWDEIEIQSRIV